MFLSILNEVILSGWQTTGIFTWQDGLPFTIGYGTNQAANGISGLDRANIIGNPSLPGDRSTGAELLEWFNAAAFVPAAPGSYGDTARDLLRGPGLTNLDFAMIKSFPIGIGSKEAQHIDFRAEFFNLFNHPNFANPGSTLGTPTFGRILSAGSPRIVQLALKIVF